MKIRSIGDGKRIVSASRRRIKFVNCLLSCDFSVFSTTLSNDDLVVEAVWRLFSAMKLSRFWTRAASFSLSALRCCVCLSISSLRRSEESLRIPSGRSSSLILSSVARPDSTRTLLRVQPRRPETVVSFDPRLVPAVLECGFHFPLHGVLHRNREFPCFATPKGRNYGGVGTSLGLRRVSARLAAL